MAALGLDPRRIRHALLVSVAIAASLVSWKFGAFVKNDAFLVAAWSSPAHFRSPESLVGSRAQYEFAARAIELIPPTASVSATRYLMPLVSNREVVRNPHYAERTDYFLVRLKSLSKDERVRFDARSQSSRYEELARGEGVVLLKRVINAKAGGR